MLQRNGDNILPRLAFSRAIFFRKAKLVGAYLSRQGGKKMCCAMEQGRNAPVVEATAPNRSGAGEAVAAAAPSHGARQIFEPSRTASG
ncbi:MULTISPECIES: hypothetical protein [unclassified Methylobacterium]|jgi:hypothetical protein|uniref:hypothetical protein n=1 Tax=unclassified Methylobacterium TaxID=2615210 RepID=UPI00135277F7|nr:hypothetical protein [Methylobacterium sp. 2A]MWV25901.1 hypothetical protein [Methylobacterium sp. 2A]